LPDLKLIAKRQKTAGMVYISSKSLCGEDDFGCPRLKKAAGKAGSHQVENSRYALNMKALSDGENSAESSEFHFHFFDQPHKCFPKLWEKAQRYV
jgi:hypothetical protein